MEKDFLRNFLELFRDWLNLGVVGVVGVEGHKSVFWKIKFYSVFQSSMKVQNFAKFLQYVYNISLEFIGSVSARNNRRQGH